MTEKTNSEPVLFIGNWTKTTFLGWLPGFMLITGWFLQKIL